MMTSFWRKASFSRDQKNRCYYSKCRGAETKHVGNSFHVKIVSRDHKFAKIIEKNEVYFFFGGEMTFGAKFVWWTNDPKPKTFEMLLPASGL